MENLYGVLIKTDSYAGNFEREMCAYITGHIGDCEVGREYIEEDEDEDENEPGYLFPNIAQIADEHGCYRPVSLAAGDEKFIIKHLSHSEKCNSVIIYFEEEPTPKQIAIIKERAQKFPGVYYEMYQLRWQKDKAVPIKILGFELLKSENKTTSKEI